MIDAREMGVEIARQCRWDVEQIADIFIEALVDSNWHSMAKKIEELIEIEKGRPQ